MSENQDPLANKATYLLGIERGVSELTEVSGRIDAYVREARKQGATWAEIGKALGVSLQAAQQRYGRS